MALSFNTAQLRPQDTAFRLNSGEDVSIKFNKEIFDDNGNLRQQNGLLVDKNSQIFTLVWPKLPASSLYALSRWRLIIHGATADRISSFCKASARNLGADNWKAVKTAVADCREKFQSWLLSMSNQEIVFIHADQKSADKMKDSNEMVDLINTLLADFDDCTPFSDIQVNWEVRVTPVTVSLSYEPFNMEGQGQAQGDNLHLATSEPFQPMNATEQAALGQTNEMPLLLQKILDTIAAQNQKMQEALDKIVADTTNRHLIVCKKMEELSSSLRKYRQGCGSTEEEGHSELENCLTEVESPGEEEETIPAELLFGGPETPMVPSHQGLQDSRHQHKTSKPRQHGESTSVILTKDDLMEPADRLKGALSDTQQERINLDEAVERAYKHEEIPSPKASSFCTILCLDISASMGENGGFKEMKRLLDVFIDGVEDIVTSTGIEENIGVVTFGRTSTVVQNLTNDFSRVRDAIDNIELGGRSPFIQALLVSMAAFVDKAEIISVCGVYQVRPRIIFFSDGHPTENLDGEQDYANNKMHVRTGLTRLMMNFATKDKYTKIHPVVYVPVGRNPDRELMKCMGSLSGGHYVEPKDVQKLCSYFLIQETIGKTLSCAKSGGDFSDTNLKALVSGLTPDLDDDQKSDVVKVVQQEHAKPQKKQKNRLSDFEDRFEDHEKVAAGELLPLGTRVVRGPDWHWEDQDKGGPGTVFSHASKNGWTYVAWDLAHYNRYAYGPHMGYQIWKTEDHPRLPQDQDLHIGMTVEKGPDWSPEEGLSGVKTGVIIRKSLSQKKLMVRWDDGQMQVVRFGADDKYDVMYCDLTQVKKEAPLKNTDTQQERSKPEEKKAAPVQDFERGLWQRKGDDGKWVDYSPEQNANIERIYKRRRDGTCMITRDGKNQRILFTRMTEKDINTGLEYSVKRIPYPD